MHHFLVCRHIHLIQMELLQLPGPLGGSPNPSIGRRGLGESWELVTLGEVRSSHKGRGYSSPSNGEGKGVLSLP